MKQFLLIPILCCLLCPLSHALTFTGQVIDAKTGQPVPTITVHLQDSLNTTPRQSRASSLTGAYSISWTGTPILNQSFRLSITAACGAVRPVYVRYTGSNVINTDIIVCQGSAGYLLQGTVNLPSIVNNGTVTLSLIGINQDSVVTYQDSFSTKVGTNGAFAQPYQTIPQADKLMLKATLNRSHPSYGAFLPTYANSSQSWHTATLLKNTAFISDTLRIQMIDTVRPGGPGCISGNARSGGAPLQNRIIILTNLSNVAVGFTYTNSQGAFSFTNLGLGTYKIHGDVLAKLNPALTMTLTNTKPCIPNLLFEETSVLFAARLEPLGIGSAAGNSLDRLVVSPNPVTQTLTVRGAEAIAGEKQLTVRDLSGRIIASQAFAAGETLKLNAASWPVGMYFLQLQTRAGAQAYRFSKQ